MIWNFQTSNQDMNTAGAEAASAGECVYIRV
jgi:hypothetical protein